MLEVLLLAVALSMDAFAVAIGLGAKHRASPVRLASLAGVYFGVFQALMPATGYLGGKSLFGWLASYAPWVAFILLAAIGGKMIYESFAGDDEEDVVCITQRAMLMLAIATSIDAMAAGFALPLMEFDPILACALIGLTTFAFSFAGVFVGLKSGEWLESKAELFGGVVLVLIGLKILLE